MAQAVLQELMAQVDLQVQAVEVALQELMAQAVLQERMAQVDLQVQVVLQVQAA